jgi:hypothetical protein
MSKNLISNFSNFESKLAEIKFKCNDPKTEAKIVIGLITEFLDETQNILYSHQFSSAETEVDYFKKEYPKIYEKLHYFKSIQNLEAKKSSFCFTDEQEMELLQTTRENLKVFQDHEIQMLSYFNLVEDEEKFFLRGHYKWRKNNFLFASNESFAINSISEIIGKRNAIKALIKYIDERLYQLKNPRPTISSNLKWTDTKVNLILLIYGIYISKSVNDGNVELNKLIEVFENIFNIDLKNFHTQLNDIKAKKGNQLKYIDTLKTSLENKLNIC